MVNLKKHKPLISAVIAIIIIFGIASITINLGGIIGAWHVHTAEKPRYLEVQPCADSDDKEIDPDNFNYVFYGDRKYYDKCQPRQGYGSQPESILQEAVCSLDKPAYKEYDCADDDKVCKFGVCIESPTPMTKISAKCGNNVIELGEQCDDGNMISGDGCSYPGCWLE